MIIGEGKLIAINVTWLPLLITMVVAEGI